SGEGIATNILADRLQLLQDQGIIVGQRSPDDARVITYQPTEKGLELLPTLIEIILWVVKYEKTAAPAKLITRMSQDREGFIREIRQRFSAPKAR
ncbi:MAG: winged helix-turn-helix transcriptional regulator, partial [Planctomycetaceae bacterium]|nr:winged helix-turn-helix transcriptional regulator [Planctomycetaceae bacterium]